MTREAMIVHIFQSLRFLWHGANSKTKVYCGKQHLPCKRFYYYFLQFHNCISDQNRFQIVFLAFSWKTESEVTRKLLLACSLTWVTLSSSFQANTLSLSFSSCYCNSEEPPVFFAVTITVQGGFFKSELSLNHAEDLESL